MKSRTTILFILFTAAVAVLFAADIAVGSVSIPIRDVWAALTGGECDPTTARIIRDIRLMKAVVALVAGAALAVSGLQMQTLFRNPLAGPYVLGVSSGASLGVALFILGAPMLGLTGHAWLSSLGVAGAAWIGAAATLALVAAISTRIKDIMVILILGIMMSSGVSAIVQILQYLSAEEALKSFVVWTMGSLGDVTATQLALLLPAVAYLIIFHYIPLYGVQIAFRDYRPRNGFLGSTWVGLKHFKYFLHSPQFPQLMRNTVLLSLYSLIFTFPLPILLALLLNECGSVGYKKFVQNVTYAPHFISTVVLCGMVIAFTAPDTGIINSLVVLLGGKSVDYMTQESSWRAIYVISDIWKNTGWSSIIYLAALTSIDPSLYEAAIVDGANRMQQTWHITLPGIRSTIVIMFILQLGRMMNVGFEKVYLLQNDLNLGVSEVISTYLYKKGIVNANYSYSTAIGLFNSVINFSLILISNTVSRKVGEVSLW